MKTVGFSSSPRFVEHITGPSHPERRSDAYFPAHATATLVADPRMNDFVYEGRYPDYDRLRGVEVTHVLEVYVRRPRPDGG